MFLFFCVLKFTSKFDRELQEVTTDKVYVGIKFLSREAAIYMRCSREPSVGHLAGMNSTIHCL